MVRAGNGIIKETRDYMENFEYKDDKIERIHHAEGVITQRAKRTDEGNEFVGLGGLVWQYEYTLKDHLGNTRVTFADANNSNTIEPNTEINQINHYAPFGLNLEGNWNGAAGSNKYQLTGKEWNDDFGLGMNDFGARMYDPTIGRWAGVDFLAEKYTPYNPYQYVLANPIKLIDPNGMEVTGGDAWNALNASEAKQKEANQNAKAVGKMVDGAWASTPNGGKGSFSAGHAQITTSFQLEDKKSGQSIASVGVKMDFDYDSQSDQYKMTSCVSTGSDNGPYCTMSLVDAQPTQRLAGTVLNLSFNIQFESLRENTYTVGLGFTTGVTIKGKEADLNAYGEKPINVGGGKASLTAYLAFNVKSMVLVGQSMQYNDPPGNPAGNMRVMENQFQAWSNFAKDRLDPVIYTRIVWPVSGTGFPGTDTGWIKNNP